ncbi:hypothetical protein Tco_0099137 [Tanacetum coccineum]
MQEELNEFERLEVWELVPRPDKVMVITLKWIYKVKLDELGGRGYMLASRLGLWIQITPSGSTKLKNSSLRVETSPRAWYDMLSSFLISQDFSKGLVDPSLFIRRDDKELLLKYDFDSCDPVDTPMVEKSKLDKDKEGKAINPSHYQGMIGTLLYLTTSRPDLHFAICMCARCGSAGVKIQDVAHLVVCSSWAILPYDATRSTFRSKHIDIYFPLSREHVENGADQLYFVTYGYQLAASSLKLLAENELISDQVGMRSFTPRDLKTTGRVDLTDSRVTYRWSINVNEFQRSFRHSDTERRSRSDEVLYLKNFKKDATLKLFKIMHQESEEMIRCRSEVEEAVRMISSTYSSKADNVDIWWARNKYPGVIVNESLIFVTHSLFQVRISKGMKRRLGDRGGGGVAKVGGGGGGGAGRRGFFSLCEDLRGQQGGVVGGVGVVLWWMVLIVELEVLIVELFVDLFVGLFVVVFVEEK